MKKSLNNYKCELCNYNTCKKSDYNKHILTRKHKMATIIEQKNLKKKMKQLKKIMNTIITLILIKIYIFVQSVVNAIK